MRLLILGGTRFLGPAIAYCANADGLDVTAFCRGKTPHRRLQGVHYVQGDRNKQLDLLEKAGFDAVVDTSAFQPEQIAQSSKRFSNARCYCFISSVSVYKEFSTKGIREDAPLLAERDTDDSNAYGVGKAECEAELVKRLRERTFIVRPGILAGPGDYTDRFTYWAYRLSRKGNVVTPDRLEDRPMQILDVRDLASWIVHAICENVNGVFNAVAPHGGQSFQGLVTACQQIREGEQTASIHEIPDTFLESEKVPIWTGLPFWIPASQTDLSGLLCIDGSKAEAAKLQCRPLHVTASDTRDWLEQTRATRRFRVGITRSEGARIIKRYKDVCEVVPK